MKLKVHHKNNTVQSTGKDRPTITVRETGLITLSNFLASELRLEGRKIAFAEDEERVGDWHLMLDHPEGFELRALAADKNKKALVVQSKSMAKKILSSLKLTDELAFSSTISIPVALQPVEERVHALLTKGAFSSQRKPSIKKRKVGAA